VVIGVHGAGLTNAALANEGLVLVELKSTFSRESELFKRLTEGKRGGYVWANTVPGNMTGRGQGLSAEMAKSMVECALALWVQGKGVAEQKGFEVHPDLYSPPCACECVGGPGAAMGLAAPGLYGYAPVGSTGPVLRTGKVLGQCKTPNSKIFFASALQSAKFSRIKSHGR